MKLEQIKDKIKYEEYYSLFKSVFPCLKKNSISVRLMKNVQQNGPLSWYRLQCLTWKTSFKSSDIFYGHNILEQCRFMLLKTCFNNFTMYEINDIGLIFLDYVEKGLYKK